MEIIIYYVIAYIVGMFLSSAIVQLIDPYGFYVDEPVYTVFWPVMFPFWCMYFVAKTVNNLVSNILP